MIEEVFENLVDQFSDPFTFYRELIQNAMDAGSNRVEVRVEYRPAEQRVVVDVVDFGEGMNQRIINTELTRLFSSSKENDLTKIGKFGIGFVSVFALNPEVVTVDTGRDGEYWRVVFQGGTNFECLKLDHPVEGTRVRLYKRLQADEFDHFLTKSRDTISFWCRFSDTEVLFNGLKLNEPLAVDSPCQVRHTRPGTELVVGVTSVKPPPFGMYNRGLTLKEAAQEFFPGVCFRIKSRYLEHTLTRDNVIVDENYHKALKILRECVRNHLPEEMFARIKSWLYDSASFDKLDELLGEAAPYLSNYREGMAKKFRTMPLFPTLHGAPLSLSQLRWASFFEGAVYLELEPNRVSSELARVGIPVLKGEVGSGIALAAQAVTGRSPLVASHSVAVPIVRTRQAARRELSRLGGAIKTILKRGKVSIQEVRLASFDYPGSVVEKLPALLQSGEGVPIRLFDRGILRSLRVKPGLLLLNESHPLVARALARAEHTPLLASFVLAKAALLNDGLSSETEASLVGQALKLA
ncbi:MAG: hypothetical protein AMXMBFR33_37670 [Candidatus Xenobia bacterium]